MVEPLRPLTLEDEHKAKYAFRPQSDITPMEAVLISQLFVRMVMTVWSGPVDWPTYVTEQKLDRHFVRVTFPVPPNPYAETRDVKVPPPLEVPRDALSVTAHGRGILETIENDQADVPKRVTYVASRDIPSAAPGASPLWLKGERLTLLEGMPVPDGFVPAKD